MNDASGVPSGSLRRMRIIAGICVGLVIIIVGFSVLDRLQHDALFNKPELTAVNYLLFYAAVTTIYIVTVALWGRFSRFALYTRSFFEKFIDTGMLAIGKYVPGKVLGVLSRGVLRSDVLVVDRHMIKISVLEQVCVMSVGMLLSATFFISVEWFEISAFLLTVFLITASWLTMSTLLLLAKRYMGVQIDPNSSAVLFGFIQALGYLFLWFLSSIPILVLITTQHSLLPVEALQIISAFTVAMLSGWVAVFAPGGLGVRESVFVMLAPDFMTWQEAGSWIVLHRVLITFFDIGYGLLSSILVARHVNGLEVT